MILISKEGFEKVNNGFITVFLIASSAVIFYSDIPGVFQQRENGDLSRDLYLRHINLRNEIRSYLYLPPVGTGDSIEINKFIHSTDNKLK